jgi:hypothetical protein
MIEGILAITLDRNRWLGYQSAILFVTDCAGFSKMRIERTHCEQLKTLTITLIDGVYHEEILGKFAFDLDELRSLLMHRCNSISSSLAQLQAMSTAELGLPLAEMIRRDKVHAALGVASNAPPDPRRIDLGSITFVRAAMISVIVDHATDRRTTHGPRKLPGYHLTTRRRSGGSHRSFAADAHRMDGGQGRTYERPGGQNFGVLEGENLGTCRL